ncbi:MAG: J domain-containing protein [Candidatus Omnitrophica bacterium]|nr:J domain-containing protein [Candidatus Omnitrophota bacterium]
MNLVAKDKGGREAAKILRQLNHPRYEGALAEQIRDAYWAGRLARMKTAVKEDINEAVDILQAMLDYGYTGQYRNQMIYLFLYGEQQLMKRLEKGETLVLGQGQLRIGTKDPYEILGVERTAIPEEIRTAFRNKVKKMHPDHNLGSEESTTQVRELIEAYEMLKDKAMAALEKLDKAAIVENPGGIDFNSSNLNLQIKRDGKGIPLPMSQQDLAQIGKIEGLTPVIIEIKAMTAIPVASPS